MIAGSLKTTPSLRGTQPRSLERTWTPATPFAPISEAQEYPLVPTKLPTSFANERTGAMVFVMPPLLILVLRACGSGYNYRMAAPPSRQPSRLRRRRHETIVHFDRRRPRSGAP